MNGNPSPSAAASSYLSGIIRPDEVAHTSVLELHAHLRSDSVPDRVRDALTALNAHDATGFTQCFTHAPSIDAWGIVFEGVHGVSTWFIAWVMEFQVRFSDFVALRDADTVSIRARVNSAGYNGPVTLQFTTDDDRLTALRITK